MTLNRLLSSSSFVQSVVHDAKEILEKNMTAWNAGSQTRAKGGSLLLRASQPQDFEQPFFFLAVFFRVTHDGLNETGNTRSLDPKWLTCILITSLNSCEFAVFLSICQLGPVDLKKRTINLKETRSGSHLQNFGRIFCRNPLFSRSIEPINGLFLTFMSLFCSTVLEQLKTLGETGPNSLRQNHAAYRSQGLSKFVRSSVRPLVRRSFARTLVRSSFSQFSFPFIGTDM